MKKIAQNQYVIAGTIIVLAIGIGWGFTYGNKQWLLNRLAEREEVTEAILKSYASKTTKELRMILKR